MIDKTDFALMREDMEGFDAAREESITTSREIIKLSKRIIYATLRDDLAEAEKILPQIRNKVKKLKSLRNIEEGHYRTALQEYVEAECFNSLVTKKKLPRGKELKVGSEHYLLGICDLSGELVRRAINSAIKKNYDEAVWIRKFLEELYGEMLKFDFRNGDLRRKFDGIKYDLQKLDDLIFDIELRRK